MAKYTGKTTLGLSYNVKAYAPLDTRMIVEYLSDLTLAETWTIGGKDVSYNGLLTVVANDTAENCGVYYLQDAQAPSAKDAPDYTKLDNWHKLCSLTELDTLADRVTALEESLGTPGGITEEELNAAIEGLRQEIVDKGYLTADALNGYAKTEDLGGYATTTSVNELLAEYAKKSELPSLDGYVTDEEFSNHVTSVNDTLSNYYTKTEVDEEVTSLNDLISAKASQSDLDDLSTTVSDLSTRLTNHTHTDLVSKEELNSTTESLQSSIDTVSSNLSNNYYNKEETKAEIQTAINNAQLEGGETDIDLSIYATKAELDGYVTNEELSGAFDNIAVISGGNASTNFAI